MKILLIEDEPELSTLGKQQMTLLGHEVVTAANLHDAQELWNDQGSAPFNLIITDHRLPDGRGIDFVIDLKERFPKLKSAVVSGCLTLTDRQLLKLYNIPYFLKPVLYSSVLQELRRPPSVVGPKASTAAASEEAPSAPKAVEAQAPTPKAPPEPAPEPVKQVEQQSPTPKATSPEENEEPKGQFSKFLSRFKKG